MSVVPANLVAELFEAASVEDGLGRVAKIAAHFVGVEGAAIVLARDGKYLANFTTENIREQSHLYHAHYHKLDPWRMRGSVSGRDLVVLANEIYPEEDLVRTEFYNDFAKPMGMFRPMSAYFSLIGGERVTLGVEQPFATRPLELEDKARFQELIVFVKRALEVRLRLQIAELKAEVGTSVLESLSLGIVVTDARGHIFFANPAAESMSENRSGLQLKAGRVSALRDDDAMRLREQLRKVGGRQESQGGLRLSDENGRPAAIAVVSPLPMAYDGGLNGAVMISVRSLEESLRVSEDLVRSMFGLSPTQAAIALDVAEGRSVDEIAATRSIKPVTVRWHLGEIFRRCGVDSQRQLVRLLTAIPKSRHQEP